LREVKKGDTVAEQVWVYERATWAMRLMHSVDAREAVQIGDYAYAPVGGYAPPQPTVQREERPREAAA
jgi:hypothetical protein